MRLCCVTVSEKLAVKNSSTFDCPEGTYPTYYYYWWCRTTVIEHYFAKRKKKIVKKSGTNWSIAHIKKKLQSSSKNWFLYVLHTSSYISKKENKNTNKWTKTLYYICYRQWCSISSHLLNKRIKTKLKTYNYFSLHILEYTNSDHP